MPAETRASAMGFSRAGWLEGVSGFSVSGLENSTGEGSKRTKQNGDRTNKEQPSTAGGSRAGGKVHESPHAHNERLETRETNVEIDAPGYPIVSFVDGNLRYTAAYHCV